jgi:MFS transporter, DHA1 family, inner membrane transport protein
LWLALALFSVASIGTAIAPSFQLALLGRVASAGVHGLFWSLLVPTAASLAPPALVGRAVSVVLAGPTLAGIIGVPVGAAIGAAVGWRVAFLSVAAALALAALAVRLLVPPDPVVRPDPGVTTEAEPTDPSGSASGAVAVVAAAAALVLTGHFVLYTYISPLLQDFGGYGGASRPALLLVFGLAGLAGIAVSGPLSDRYPRSALTWVSVAFAGSALSLRLIAVDEPAAFLVLAIWGALIGLLPPVFQIRLLRTAKPGTEATAGAIGITVVNLGIAAGAALGGLTVRVLDVGSLPVVAAVVIATSAAAQVFSDVRASGR